MLRVSVVTPADLAPRILATLQDDHAVSAIVHQPGAAVRPAGDLIVADVAREGVNEILDALRSWGLHERGSIHVEPSTTWLSRDGFEAERRTPGSSADAVVWADVTQRAYDESELNWTYASFMTMATMISAIALVLDSQVLLIGAMVLGPEFVPIAALGLALVRRRPGLLRQALRALLVGFVVAIAVATLASLLGRWWGWIEVGDLVARPETEFVYSPDRWSFVVAVIAGAAGVLSLTSAKVGGLSGVFISVTTVPAAGNIALALAFGVWDEVVGSSLQLLVNIVGMAVAGWLTLTLQHLVWQPVSARRAAVLERLRHRRERPAA
ncbi:DUF389 domain-containing protein [Nocardioides sp. TRM66260-LWL]|uniref:DUF389 domain-containing protein n=1 Tax=Nocardioides sp. TRM66260-LWL TaxID=2874478 RepID=UPI001CC35901|nr:DUF389 domain-containing protein [Nocardioides sp. TRM66260-LWL]MBZ5735794.1 DUF389 domain-containing protein [Nocardioides sp. TRM66260-LWL]